MLRRRVKDTEKGAAFFEKRKGTHNLVCKG